MNKTLLISSLACIALLVYVPVDAAFLKEYHHHQKEYKQQLLRRASNEIERELAGNYTIKIRQLMLPKLNRVDRCVSCHVAMEDPHMAEAANPLMSHPGDFLIEHDMQKVGCTVCHDGQGRAMLSDDAHAVHFKGWDKPLLKPPFLKSNCLRCHEAEELEILELAKKGKRLFYSKGCLGCHKLQGKGGETGPDLTNIADASPHLKRPVQIAGEELQKKFHGNQNLGYIYESVKIPDAQPPVSAMVDFEFTEDEALSITAFLKGVSRKAIPASYLVKRSEKKRREEFKGAELFGKYCIACHGEGGRGGVENKNYAKESIPALNTLAEKMFIEYSDDAEYLAELLMDGEDIENMSPPLDMEGRARVLAQYRAIKDVIKKGSTAARAETDGPAPFLHMPSWAEGLTDSAIDSILAYMLLQYPWEEEE